MVPKTVQGPRSIALFILMLAVVQAAAFERQFILGFVPFVHEPTRVPFSWDMFANRVERCTLEWAPPLQLGDHQLARLRDVEVPFEWDVTFDRAADYRMTGDWLCHMGGFQKGPGSTQVKMKCFIQNGTEFHDQFNCP